MKVVRKFDHAFKTKRTNKSISKGPSKKVLRRSRSDVSIDQRHCRSKIRLMVVELLQLEVLVHGCSNTNRNENYYLLSSRGVDSFDEAEGNKAKLAAK